jgi:hypothetical protein
MSHAARLAEAANAAWASVRECPPKMLAFDLRGSSWVWIPHEIDWHLMVCPA